MLSTGQRDRDDVGTVVPVLIPAFRGERRDGFIPRDYVEVDDEGNGHSVTDLTVRMVPFKQMALLIQGEVGRRRAENWRLTKRERAQLTSLATLVQAKTTRDRSKLESYVRMESGLLAEGVVAELNKWTSKDRTQIALSRVRDPYRTIGNELNYRLKNARFVMWWVEQQKHFAPGILCRDLYTAIVALLVSRVTASQNFAVCSLPSCGRQFVRVKKNNRYCSRKCGDTHRKQLSRARLRRRQKKGEGNVTQKTR
jgi:hypothetical protein